LLLDVQTLQCWLSSCFAEAGW